MNENDKIISRFLKVLCSYTVLIFVVHLIGSWIEIPSGVYLFLGVTPFGWAMLEHDNLGERKIYNLFLSTSLLFILLANLLDRFYLSENSDDFLTGSSMMICFLIPQRIMRHIYKQYYEDEPIFSKSARALKNVLYTLFVSVTMIFLLILIYELKR